MLTIKPLAPAVYAGHQDIEGQPGFDLWLLTGDIEGHPVGSSVSSDTLSRAGYAVPNRQDGPAAVGTAIRRANLRETYRHFIAERWSEENREKLFSACFTEWGPRWRSRIYEEDALKGVTP